MGWMVALPTLVAATLVAAIPGLLRALPAPVGEPDAAPYDPLATRAFAVTAAALMALAGTTAFVLAPVHWPAWTGLASCGVLSAMIDARTGYLPRPLAWAAWALTGLGLTVVALLAGFEPMLRAGVGAASATALFWVFWRVGGGFGFGDVRLAPVIGASAAAVGWPVFFGAFILGGLAGVGWGLCWRAMGRGRSFPYGPALVAGPFLALAVWSLTT